MVQTLDVGDKNLEPGFRYGLRQSLMIVIGYAPVAITFGLLAAQYGISVWEAGLMSLMVFAGASQFIAIEMIHQGATVWMIVFTALIVNIRHVLMSLAIVPFFPQRNSRWSLALAQGLTDETFVLNSGLLKEIESEEARRKVMLGVNLGAFSSWVVFTLVGGLIGEWLPLDFAGFKFALLALFLVLTAGTLQRKNLMTFVLAGALAVAFRVLLPGKFYLILSVGLAAAWGAWRATKRSSAERGTSR